MTRYYRRKRSQPAPPRFTEHEDVSGAYDVQDVYTRDFERLRICTPPAWDKCSWLAFSDQEDYPINLTPGTQKLFAEVIGFVHVEVIRELVKLFETHSVTRRVCKSILGIEETPVTAEVIRRRLMELDY